MASGKAFMYETIYNDLLEGIRNGTYPAGSRLPSEKELAGQYGVSRITSKKALELLAERGMISRMPGRGSFVLETAVNTTDTGNKRADPGDPPDREDHWRDPGQF